jgi:paraquat-inducible protein A
VSQPADTAQTLAAGSSPCRHADRPTPSDPVAPLTLAESNLIACPECDLLQQQVALPAGGVAICPRCQGRLYRSTPHGLQHSLAFSLASVILFLLANSFPIIGLELQKSTNATTLLGSVAYLFNHGLQPVAILVLLTTVLVPALELLAMLAILLPLQFNRVGPGLAHLFRLVQWIHPWGMVEVFMLGIIVSLIRVSGFAEVQPGIALWSFAALMLLMAGAAEQFNERELWARVAQLQHA